ncbi:hypothetical protein [Enterococcus gilvus]|uniref:hypothetical protein n=1 Tax=Enterococcus gilvus TaxID=160453 RepID=UPI003ED96DF3
MKKTFIKVFLLSIVCILFCQFPSYAFAVTLVLSSEKNNTEVKDQKIPNFSDENTVKPVQEKISSEGSDASQGQAGDTTSMTDGKSNSNKIVTEEDDSSSNDSEAHIPKGKTESDTAKNSQQSTDTSSVEQPTSRIKRDPGEENTLTGVWGTAPWSFDKTTGVLEIGSGDLQTSDDAPYRNDKTISRADIKEISFTGRVIVPVDSSFIVGYYWYVRKKND